MIKKVLLISALVLGTFSLSLARENKVASIVPYPNDVQMGEGFFNAAGAAVVYDASVDEATVNIIKAFAGKLSSASGKESPVSVGTSGNGFVFASNASVPFEAYTLEVKPEGVRVEASSMRGFNYAIQTIKQLLPVQIFSDKQAADLSWTLPVVYINDAPRFAYRGLHLDEGRHFFGVEEVKRYLDLMEVHKLNKFHWHLTEDQGWRIEIKKYPRLTEIGSVRKGTCIRKNFTSHNGIPYGEGMWYTQDQIREIVAYAASKGIDVIPEIDLPGHMQGALAAYPELGCTGGPYEVWTRWGVSEDVLCAGNEKVYEFLEDVLTEVCDLFPYEYIHIGGDECPKVRWESCPKCQAKIKELGLSDKDGQKAEHYLQSYVITRIEKFLNSKGRNVIGWDEILEGGIAPNATIMSWRGETGGIEATKLGHKAIMTPNTYYYLDYYQSTDVENEPFGIGGYLPVERCYSYEPYAESMTAEQRNLIWGVQGNLWTEYIATADHLYYMLLPRFAALAEVQWCKPEIKDWERFYAAADEFCAIYDTMGYNYAKHIFHVSADVSSAPETKTVTVSLATQGGAPIRYTLDGTEPTEKSKLYKKPLTIKKTTLLKATSFRDGMEPKVLTKKFDFNKATGADITFSRKPHARYTPASPKALVDGLRGPQVYKSQEWTAWHGKPVDIVLDMKKAQSFSSVVLGMLSNKPSYLFLPESVTISVSEDGKEYREVAAESYGVESKDSPDVATDLQISFAKVKARYVKVSITPVKTIPDWHYAAGKRTFVFVDEIMIY